MIIGLLCVLVYTANFRSISAGDTYPARYLPFAIWNWHTVLLDPITGITAQGRTPITPHWDADLPVRTPPHYAYWAVRLDTGHVVSLYPIVVPLLVSPLYLPAVAYLDATGWDPARLDRVAKIMEKVSASLIAGISVALFYFLLRRTVTARPALLLTFAYALGTTTWMISSQALWQHGVGELLVICALLLLTGPRTRARTIAAGFVLGLIACNRPPDALISAALGVYGIWRAGRLSPFLIVAALAPAIPLLIYNLGIVGNIAGGYGLMGDPSFFGHDVLTGLAGLLFSPTKGLLVFSPFLIFVPFCVPHVLRDQKTRGLGIAAVCAVALQLLVYASADWRQGSSWGPRWLSDVLPLLVWMLIPLATEFGRIPRAIFSCAVGASVIIEAIGAFWYTGKSDALVYASAAEPNPMRAAWQLQNAPFIAELRHARAPSDLAADVRGYLDVMKTSNGDAGREIRLIGWAVADAQSPAEVLVMVDGHQVASATSFSARADVSKALGITSPSGWHATFPTSRIGRGKHTLSVLARAHPDGKMFLIVERSFDVPAESGLDYSAHLAADLLSSRQQQPGYWLTSHTTQARFEHRREEMNTYLPSVMLDILDPVAKSAGLNADVQKARHFLRDQIEADGLVRYHGRPDAPTIGKLGCAITPDADDTALVWRIAPGAHAELLSSALEKIAEFRTADGLYRTWLAPKDQYRCIDPGSDPNPADIGIQMHLLLLLAKTDASAARDLCSAIQRSANDDRFWVYYKRAPLIPMLRQADLRDAGCSMQLPETRQETDVPGQQLWISAARLLDRARSAGAPATGPEVRAWLQRVAEDEFSIVRRSPPLLYHNDQTASVSRYYWSEDFGYALWLRLYYEMMQHQGKPS